MKTTIEVKDRKEADLIKIALDDPTTRAFVQVVGALLPLTPRERARVMNFVSDKVDEDREAANNGN
jgi:hypothetical protein